VDGTAVSFWHHTEAIRQRPTIAQLSHLLTLMHGIPAADIALPHWNPIPDLRARIACGSCWDARDLAFLERRCAAVESALLELRFSSPAAVIHGDAHPGNIIMAENGPVLCDLDTVSIGPREWDLVPVAVSQLRFRQLVDVHDEMAAAYGMDVTAWDGFPVLRELRELSLATGGPMASLHPAAGFEVRRRLRSLRTRRDGMAWIPLGSARQR
jgi:aminoglycoside phosphotransferase (APT) family kinase protein